MHVVLCLHHRHAYSCGVLLHLLVVACMWAQHGANISGSLLIGTPHLRVCMSHSQSHCGITVVPHCTVRIHVVHDMQVKSHHVSSRTNVYAGASIPVCVVSRMHPTWGPLIVPHSLDAPVFDMCFAHGVSYRCHVDRRPVAAHTVEHQATHGYVRCVTIAQLIHVSVMVSCHAFVLCVRYGYCMVWLYNIAHCRMQHRIMYTKRRVSSILPYCRRECDLLSRVRTHVPLVRARSPVPRWMPCKCVPHAPRRVLPL